ncbi:hypothetical protein [Granulosicoccus antarcticus]|uniref:Lipoprotein n=1 Tax=Granulosicoccus antarcticus IMCC3135 TaxID=1192854 RepID=A0A2Z2NPW3_9GAMM|nr:hypothetical protein [Granulosicoccus antarcticus]ASJ71971.1 hypothetical protein IMCC3135_09370 [Granulosicoccus antarcticus IMCC3135]
MQSIYRFATVAFLSLTLASCASVSSSVPTAESGSSYAGKVLVTQSELPEGTSHTVLGTVKANARAGYGNVERLYPLLADEARALGANAVVGVEGGRMMSMWSWAAPTANGTAVRIDNESALSALPGDSL